MDWKTFNHCQLCQQNAVELICKTCLEDLELFNWLDCDFNLLNRPDIRKGLTNTQFDSLLALSFYQPPISLLVSALKFKRNYAAFFMLRQLFEFQFLNNHFAQHYDIIVPVPLHKRRWLRRSYNQAALLSNAIASLLRHKTRSDLLSRTENTLPQTQLSAASRRKNLKDAFCIAEELTGQRILLVDDVLTTGTTVNTITEVLKQSGSGEVDVMVACVAAV
jgi:ComF family protein